MKETNFKEIHNKLTNEVTEYINAIKEEYGKFIPKERLEYLNNIKDYSEIIRIHDYGNINGYANDFSINMPLCADKVLQTFEKIPGYGINKNHSTYNKDTLINNNNTFATYIQHVFISGTNTEKYYEDLLLHETMHFCGSGGATALKEGINELLTRKLALKKNFITNGCGYPKEVDIAYQLQNILGEDVINQIAFINSNKEIYFYLENTLGTDAANLYMNVSDIMEREFYLKYYKDMDNYNGLIGIYKKIKNYTKTDYSGIYKLIANYQQNNNKHNKK